MKRKLIMLLCVSIFLFFGFVPSEKVKANGIPIVLCLPLPEVCMYTHVVENGGQVIIITGEYTIIWIP